MRETDSMENPPHEAPELRIVNRYMPSATPEEREEAMTNLKQLARALMRIETRLAREWYAQQIRDSGAAAVESELQSSPPL
jgi:aminoglycoside/choline kinase family phosphotransferase